MYVSVISTTKTNNSRKFEFNILTLYYAEKMLLERFYEDQVYGLNYKDTQKNTLQSMGGISC